MQLDLDFEIKSQAIEEDVEIMSWF